MENLNTNNFIVPDWPVPHNVVALSTTRKGGVSLPPYNSLNLATHVNDDPYAIQQNRRLLYQALELQQPIEWLTQVHGTRAIAIDKETENLDADACFTQSYQTVCAVLTADCLPILICNDNGSEVAAIHAGWKGLLAGVIESTIAALSSPASRLYAWLGPAIGPESFEVNEQIRLDFIQKNPQNSPSFEQLGGKWFADIYQLGCTALRNQGVSQLFGGGMDTVSNEEWFFSYRRDGEKSGRMASIIYLK